MRKTHAERMCSVSVLSSRDTHGDVSWAIHFSHYFLEKNHQSCKVQVEASHICDHNLTLHLVSFHSSFIKTVPCFAITNVIWNNYSQRLFLFNYFLWLQRKAIHYYSSIWDSFTTHLSVSQGEGIYKNMLYHKIWKCKPVSFDFFNGPMIFIYTHREQYDIFMYCRLLKDYDTDPCFFILLP